MPRIVPARVTAAHDGPLVVFVIGMRINRLWRVDKWLPVARAMGPMIAELSRDKESGFLGTEYALAGLRTVLLIQYWRDFDSLEAYARARDGRHWPAWTAFNKAIGTDARSAYSTRPTPPARTRRSTSTCPRSASARSVAQGPRPARAPKREGE